MNLNQWGCWWGKISGGINGLDGLYLDLGCWLVINLLDRVMNNGLRCCYCYLMMKNFVELTR